MNDWTIREVAEHAPERLLPFCGVPITVGWNAAEVLRCGRSGGRGLKLHVPGAGLSLLNGDVAAALTTILGASVEAKLPVLIHVPMDSREEVLAFFDIAASVPDAQLIAAHQIAQNLALLVEAPPNVWIEISGLTFAPVEATDAFVSTWRQFGIERVMLGSDWPTLGLTPLAHVERVQGFPLTPDELHAIMHGNGLKLLPPRRLHP